MGDLEPVILGIVSKLSISGGSATITKQNTIIADVAVVNALVAVIKAKTDNLPAAPADETLLEAAIADLISRAKGLDDIHDDVGTVGTLVDAIKAKTDNLPAAPADETLLEAAIADLITRAKGLDDIHDDVGTVGTVVDVINTEVSEILDMTRTGADVMVTAAETDLFIDDAPTKIINGIAMRINLSNMGAADTYEFREYYRMTSGGTPICGDPLILSGVQLNPRLSFALEPYRYGCKVTSTKTAGADISFEIEAIREA